MAKKNLTSLMDGILGDNKAPEETQNESSQIAEKKTAVAKPRRSAKNDVHATIVVDADIMRKIKYIAIMENVMIKNVIGDALSKKIEEWEKENGTITFRTKK